MNMPFDLKELIGTCDTCKYNGKMIEHKRKYYYYWECPKCHRMSPPVEFDEAEQ